MDIIIVGSEEQKNNNPEWYNLLTEREIREVEFARIYSTEFGHGTDGHNRLNLITKLADILNQNLIPPFRQED